MNSEPVEVTERDWVMAGIAFVMLCLAVVLMVINMVALTRQSGQLEADAKFAQTNRAALCQLQGSIRDQRDQTIKYLTRHPGGVPALGISATQLQQSVQKLTDEIEALRPLRCG